MAISKLSRVPDWATEIERGPDWLLVRITPSEETRGRKPYLSTQLLDLLKQHLTSRLVLDLEDVERLPPKTLGELASLSRTLRDQGGVMRLCGLSSACRNTIDREALDDDLPSFESRQEAVWGRPTVSPH